MPSVVNLPPVGMGSGISIADAAEHVIATVSRVDVDTPEHEVRLRGLVELLNSASGASATLKLRRGSTISSTLVATCGPIDLVASKRSDHGIFAVDVPGSLADGKYVLTALVTSNVGTVTIEAALLEVIIVSNS